MKLDEYNHIRSLNPYRVLHQKGNDWGAAPNPTRNLRFLDFPIRFAAAKIILTDDAHARRMLKTIKTGAKRRRESEG